ncbi:hypothetical protein EU527_11440 [Candidatus Thorarchaeota archaeon]|nr:MAG: hypothetical protein EU527_11440 [Candidatus Thorarchaeota archaeon]
MLDRLAWLKEYLLLFPKRVVAKWALLVFSAYMFFFIVNFRYGSGTLDSLFSVFASIGWLIATGLPFLLGSSLLVSGEAAHNGIAKKASSNEIRFLPFFVIYLLLMILAIATMAISGITSSLINGNPTIVQYLPHFLGISAIISLLVSPIYLLLALSIDSSRISIVVGLVASVLLMLALGSPRYPVKYPEVALFHPAHLLSALLFVSIGAYGQYAMDYYVGMRFELVNLVLPVVLWVVIFFVSYLYSKRMFFSNLCRWSLEWDDWILSDGSQQNVDSSVRFTAILKANRSLESRRKKVIAIAIGLMIFLPIAATSYVQVRQEEWTQLVYESPSGGETLTIGEWSFGSFSGVEPPPSFYLMVGCSGRILDWDGGLGYIEYSFQYRGMTLIDFLNLNETEFEDLFEHSWGTNLGTSGAFGGGWQGPIGDEDYIWVLKLIDVNGRTSGLVNVWFKITIRMM